MEPPFRFSTKTALDELAVELNLRDRIPFWDAVAGHSYTPSNKEDVQQYIDYYSFLKDDDKRFTLMEMILDALAHQPSKNVFTEYWDKVQPILIRDYSIHQYTIHYWKQMTDDEFKLSNIMTPIILNLISQMESKEA